MRVFADNPGRVLSEFSGLFLKGFLDTLSHRHGTKRVLANTVYQEYISDKDHVHMNSTAWSSLSGLCKFLGREGKCVVDETEKGWYIQYIDKDPKLIAKQAQMEARQKSELDEEERTRRLIEKQIAAATARGENVDEEESEGDRELVRSETDGKIQVSLGRKTNISSSTAARSGKGLAFGEQAVSAPSSSASSDIGTSSRPQSALESLMQEEERRKSQQLLAEDRSNRKDYWLHAGIVVKVMNKTVGDGRFYKEKGVVVGVIDKYIGEVRVSGKRLRLDQEDLETVIPKAGGAVLIVNGRGRGYRAVVLRLNESDYNCDIRIEDGPHAGREVTGVEYEDISKLSDEL